MSSVIEMVPFTLLNQDAYKDDDGHDVPAKVVQYLAPYQYMVDGFYKWECAGCKAVDSSRACGWPISGQVLRCDGCGAMNLLVRTNTIQLDECVRNKLDLERGLEDLKRDREQFDKEVQRAARQKISTLRMTLESTLEQIEDVDGGNGLFVSGT